MKFKFYRTNSTLTRDYHLYVSNEQTKEVFHVCHLGDIFNSWVISDVLTLPGCKEITKKEAQEIIDKQLLDSCIKRIKIYLKDGVLSEIGRLPELKQ